jgi:Ribbon-helix-helix protein, copG family
MSRRPSDLRPTSRSAQLNLRLRPSELEALTKVAEAEDRPVSEIVRRALDEYLSNLDEDEILGKRRRKGTK